MYDPLFAAWCRSRLSRSRGRGDAKLIEVEQQILEALHPKQRAYALDPAERFAALTGRGAGKTTAARARFVIKANRIGRARLLFVATTKDQAEDLMWEPLKELLDKLSIRASFNETKLRCVLTDSKSLIWLVGADDKKTVEKLRGRPWHEVIIDEAASYSSRLLENLIDRIIGPRLGDFDGVLGMQGTPGHSLSGMFYEATRYNSEVGRLWEERDDPAQAGAEWSVHKWTLQDGVAAGIKAAIGLWAAALRNKAKKKWSDRHPIWMREYLGIWAADETEMMYHYRPHDEEGRPFNQWNPERVDGWAVLPEIKGEWHHAIGMDLGHGTPFALQVAAFSPSDPDRHMYQRFEFFRRGMYAKKIAELLIGEAAVKSALSGTHLPVSQFGGVIGKIGGWPDAMVADLANLGEAVVRELGDVYGIPIAAAKKKDKPGAVELTNGDLGDGVAHILKGSNLESEMSELQWRVDEYGQLREPKHGDNACDGWIYVRNEVQRGFTGDEKPKGPVFPPRPDPMAEPDEKPASTGPFAELLSEGRYEEDEAWGRGW